MITISCPKCVAQFRTKEENVGLKVKCKSCAEVFEITMPTEEPVVELVEIHETPSQPAPPQQTARPAAPNPPDEPAPIQKKTPPSDVTQFKTFGELHSPGGVKEEKYEYTQFEKDLLPAPPWKNALSILSIVLLTLSAGFLIIGSIQNGFLTDAGHDKRFIIAGFAALICGGGFIASSKKTSSGILLAVLSTAILFSLAFFLPIYATPSKGDTQGVKTYSIGPLKNEPRLPINDSSPD